MQMSMGVSLLRNYWSLSIIFTDISHKDRGTIGQNSTFAEHGHVAYQFKGNQEMQQHGSKYFAHRPPAPRPTLGFYVWLIRSLFKAFGPFVMPI